MLGALLWAQHCAVFSMHLFPSYITAVESLAFMLLSQAVKLRLRERESLAQSHMGDYGESRSLTCLLSDPTPLTQTLKHQREMRSPVLLYRMNAFLKNGVSVREGPPVPAGNIN